MWALHSILNMPEYALTEFWIYLLNIGSKYATILNMIGFWICHIMAKYAWIGLEYAWIYDNRQVSEYVPYSA